MAIYTRGDYALYDGKEVHIDLHLVGTHYQVSWHDTSRGGRQCETVDIADLSDIPPYVSPAQARLDAAAERVREIEGRMTLANARGDKVAVDEDLPVFTAALHSFWFAWKEMGE